MSTIVFHSEGLHTSIVYLDVLFFSLPRSFYFAHVVLLGVVARIAACNVSYEAHTLLRCIHTCWPLRNMPRNKLAKIHMHTQIDMHT